MANLSGEAVNLFGKAQYAWNMGYHFDGMW
jgi:hypothetical protein